MTHRFGTSLTLRTICLASICLGVALAGPPAKDVLSVSGGTDTLGFTPTTPGSAPNQIWYAVSAPAGTAVADTIPISFSVSDINATPGQTYILNLKAVGGIASAITFDNASFTIPDSGAVVLDNIYVNTTTLAPGDYIANVLVSASPANALSIGHDIIHLHIHVAPAPNVASCFVTDSTGLLLYDCDGISPVSSGGEFAIVYNKSKITATNPGQFYYNLEWTNNTGSTQVLNFTLHGSNVLPKGANSVHYMVYDQTQFTVNVFDTVNADGTPCGPMGSTCTSITVPDGQTLWLTWHVAYQWIGSKLWSDIPLLSACPAPSAHGTISMGAAVTNADSTVSFICTGTANGYKLQ